jgi:hypothetical protein
MPDTSPSYHPPSSNFTVNVGLNVDIANSDDVISFVNLFITDEFFEFICDWMNLYVEQVTSVVPHPLMKYSVVQTWKPVTMPELKQFLGLVFVTGIIEKLDLKMYWTVGPVFEIPIFSKTMFRNHFESIMSLLHFSDSSQYENNTDRLYKVRPILEKLNDNFSLVYTPQQKIALDEGMLAWSGRLQFHVYNPAKITKYGIVMRMVCEPTTGYICKLMIYDASGMTLQDTVFELLDPYLGQGFSVYMKNYYNSVRLAKQLYEQNTVVCGTIRQNRGVPNDLRDHQKTLERGEMTFRRDGEVLLVSWMEKKIIIVISTMHSAEMVEIPTKFGKKRMKPVCIEDYSQHMHGVDTADQYLASYPFIRKTYKWLKKVFSVCCNALCSILSDCFKS